MGGRGSGNWYRYGSRECLEQVLRLDVRYLKKNGMLEPGRYVLAWSNGNEDVCSHVSLAVFENRLIVGGTWNDPESGMQQSMDKSIHFTETPCRYGGSRKWLVCPRCKHKMAVLVISPPVIGCRHCLDLVYTSQRESFEYRGLRKMNKIASRLDRDEFFGEMLMRPRGMHWRTYYQLVEEYEEADRRSLFSMAARLG